MGKAPSSAAVVATCLTLAACASQGPASVDRYYTLAPTVQVLPGAKAPVEATLLVMRPRADGLSVGREMVFRSTDRPGEVQRYTFHLWSEPPATAITAALTAALREARLFAFVIAPGQRARADYLLAGELRRLEHLPGVQPPQVAAEIHLTLIDGYNRKPLFAQTYQGTEPTGQTDDPATAAAAFDRLLGRLLGDAVRDLQAQRPRLHSADTRDL